LVIIPHLLVTKRGFKTKSCLTEVAYDILYKLKQAWINLLCEKKSYLDLSSVSIDGSHTSALRGGEEVAYQGRKKRKITNSLYLTDTHGLPLTVSSLVAGNHHELYQIKFLSRSCLLPCPKQEFL